MHNTAMQYIVVLTMALPSMAGALPSSCNTGGVQCCNKLVKADSTEGQNLLGSAGVPIKGITGLVGTQCSSTTVIGVGSSTSCANSPVCCTNNNFNGVVSFGCSPVSVNT